MFDSVSLELNVSLELMNEDPLPPSPNQLALSPVSAEDDKHITNNLTYEYLPQGKILHCLCLCIFIQHILLYVFFFCRLYIDSIG
jgi:hypothetical protein